jgi:hypothetical protein
MAAATYSTAVLGLGGARLATASSVSPRSLLLLPKRHPSSSFVSASHFQGTTISIDILESTINYLIIFYVFIEQNI